MMSPGVLVWRALLQWLGGIGIIVMAMAVLPMLSIGGMQLFKTDPMRHPTRLCRVPPNWRGNLFVYAQPDAFMGTDALYRGHARL